MENFKEMMAVYYSRLFPFSDFYRWLSYGTGTNFQNREFSFTLMDDIYIRHQAFNNFKELENEVKRVTPFKIDIGAVYTSRPRQDRRVVTFKPLQRELVFDIDMNDYDEVRACCTGTDICKKCWRYMSVACKILDTALREDFGFNHILWIFSGRRGIHAWVCDPEARTLDTVERAAVVEYLSLISGNQNAKKKVNFTEDKIHHSIKRALDIITPQFVSMCVEEQEMFGNEERIDKFLDSLPDDKSRTELKELFDKYEKGTERWDVFRRYVQGRLQSDKEWRFHQHLIEEVMVEYCYPRLDINVSKGLNHLLKAPFCVHPKTGKLCVPINPNSVEDFDPMTVPTITDLLEEMRIFDEKERSTEASSENAPKIKDYKKTSLKKAMQEFHEFLKNMENSRRLKKELETSTMEF